MRDTFLGSPHNVGKDFRRLLQPLSIFVGCPAEAAVPNSMTDTQTTSM